MATVLLIPLLVLIPGLLDENGDRANRIVVRGRRSSGKLQLLRRYLLGLQSRRRKKGVGANSLTFSDLVFFSFFYFF